MGTSAPGCAAEGLMLPAPRTAPGCGAPTQQQPVQLPAAHEKSTVNSCRRCEGMQRSHVLDYIDWQLQMATLFRKDVSRNAGANCTIPACHVDFSTQERC